MAESVRRLARTEGILLDPVYAGKAMAGMTDLIQQGIFSLLDCCRCFYQELSVTLPQSVLVLQFETQFRSTSYIVVRIHEQ